MTLPDQVTSLSLSKKLKELGVKQESLFVWFVQKPPYKPFPTDNVKEEYRSKYPSAYTVAELGELTGLQTQSWKHPKGWVAQHFLSGDKQFVARTEADARALLLIHLLQNKLITL